MAALHCCVPHCVSDSRRPANGSQSFHRLPLKSAIRKEWLIKIRRDEGPLFQISSKTVVCSKHFTSSDFRFTPNRRTLKSTAVPSIFPWSSLKARRKEPKIRETQQKRTNYFSASSTPDAPAHSPMLSASSSVASAPSPMLSALSPVASAPSLVASAPSFVLSAPSFVLSAPSTIASAPSCVLPVPSCAIPSPSFVLSAPSTIASAPSCVLPVYHSVSALPEHMSVSANTETTATLNLASDTNTHPTHNSGQNSLKKENLLAEIDQLKLQLLQADNHNAFLSQQLHNEKFHLQRFSADPTLIQYYTGFDRIQTLYALYDYLKPSASNMKSIYYECSETQTMAGRPRNMATVDEFFMFLCRLHAGLQEIDLSVRFNISVATVSRKIITWANFLYISLGSICIWPSREEIDSLMPVSFRTTYPSTRVIIDCTEIRVQTPSSIHLSSQVYSNYKSTCTFKALIGIAPNGLLTFVSSLYTGCMSDVEITRLSGILDLLEPGDSVMADKGFTIQKDLSKLNVGLNIPPFRFSSGQFSQSQIEETQEIASLRIHVERAIRRIKENKLFDSVIPLSLAGTINQIFAVACMLTNFKGPLIKARL